MVYCANSTALTTGSLTTGPLTNGSSSIISSSTATSQIITSTVGLVKLDGNITTFNSSNFQNHLADAMGINASYITINNVTSGSIIVVFTVLSAPSLNSKQVVESFINSTIINSTAIQQTLGYPVLQASVLSYSYSTATTAHISTALTTSVYTESTDFPWVPSTAEKLWQRTIILCICLLFIELF